MKVIFLDYDGVLNTPKEWGNHLRNPKGSFNRRCVANLNILIDKTDAHVVVSSTWRLTYGVKALAALLVENGFEYPDKFDAITPILRGEKRGKEIQLYLDAHPEITSFVILDDDADMLHLIDKLVKTDYNKGLSYTNVEQAIKLLEGS